MGRHTGQKALRRDGTPRQHMEHSTIGTVGIPPTEPQRDYRVESGLMGVAAKDWMRREAVRAARVMRRASR